MKKLFLLLVLISTSVFAQNFQKNWNKVIANEKLGKIKSASKIVDGIYKKAVSQKNEPQIKYHHKRTTPSSCESFQLSSFHGLKSQV